MEASIRTRSELPGSGGFEWGDVSGETPELWSRSYPGTTGVGRANVPPSEKGLRGDPEGLSRAWLCTGGAQGVWGEAVLVY